MRERLEKEWGGGCDSRERRRKKEEKGGNVKRGKEV